MCLKSPNLNFTSTTTKYNGTANAQETFHRAFPQKIQQVKPYYSQEQTRLTTIAEDYRQSQKLIHHNAVSTHPTKKRVRVNPAYSVPYRNVRGWALTMQSKAAWRSPTYCCVPPSEALQAALQWKALSVQCFATPC